MTTSSRLRWTYLGVGLIAGIAFVVHASFADVGAWPLIWPALGGLVVAAVGGVHRLSFPAIAILAGRAAAVCAAVVAAVGLPVLAVRLAQVDDVAAVQEAPFPLVYTMLALAVACGIILVVLALVAAPITRWWGRPQRLGPA